MNPEAFEETIRPALALRFGPTLENARQVSKRVGEYLTELGSSESEAGKWELVIAELLANIVTHGAAGSMVKDVVVELQCGPEETRFRVLDPTEGFSWPKEVALPDPMSESGRGLFIIDSIVDEIRYQTHPNGNVTELTRKNDQTLSIPAVLGNGGATETLAAELESTNATLDEMAEELASNYESLSAIFSFSAELGRNSNVPSFTEEFLARLLEATTADWYLVRLHDAENKRLVFQAATLKEIPMGVQQSLGLEDERCLESRAALEKHDRWFNEAADIEEEDRLRELVSGFHGVVHPIVLEEELVGTVVAAKREGTPKFTAGQLSTIHTLADFYAIQIINERYKREAIQAERQGRDLEIASDIQKSLLPSALPQIPDLDLATFFESASSVGGDFYDVLYEVNPTGRGGALLSIADVMGKGVPAALFAAILRTSIRSMSELYANPGQLMSRLNRVLFSDLDRVDMFITVELVFLDFDNHRMSVSSAGHCPAIYWDNEKGEVVEISADGVPIGVLEDYDYGVTTRSWKPGDKTIIFSDGLIEARAQDGELLGSEKLLAHLSQLRMNELDCERVSASILSLVEAHQEDSAQADDLTFLVMGHR